MVDANVLLASFLKDALTRELLLDTRLSLFAPEHLIAEISRNLKRKSGIRMRIPLTNEELQGLFAILTQRIKTVPNQAYQAQIKIALSIAPHEEDAPYLAVSMLLNIPLWSNDKGLRNQSRVRVYSTNEVIKKLRGIEPN